jgi:hypothetical protein
VVCCEATVGGRSGPACQHRYGDAFNHKVCFKAQVLGYGVSFMISLYEMTSNLLITGVTRFALAILTSFIMGFGVVIGVWMAAFGGTHHFDEILDQDCSALLGQISDYLLILLYPDVSVGALMQLRISPRHWIICLIVQFVAIGSQ